MRVHIYGPSFSTFVRSVMLVCEEKHIDYQVGTEVNGRPLEFHGAEHYRLHPWGKVPVLLHGERALCETASICRYLDREFGPETLQPADGWQRAQVDQWCALISGYIDQYLVRGFMLELAFPKGENGEPRRDVVESGRAKAVDAVQKLATQLGERDWLVGEAFSLADALAAPIVTYAYRAEEPYNLIRAHTNLNAYAERLLQRPGAARVLKPMAN